MRNLICVVLLFAVPASAELYECDGTWQNKPCKGIYGPQLKPLKETPLSKESLSPSFQAKKKIYKHAWIIQGRMRKDGINFPASHIESFCKKTGIAIQECQKYYDLKLLAAEERLRIKEEKELKEKTLKELENLRTKTQTLSNQVAQQNQLLEEQRKEIEHMRIFGIPNDGR